MWVWYIWNMYAMCMKDSKKWAEAARDKVVLVFDWTHEWVTTRHTHEWVMAHTCTDTCRFCRFSFQDAFSHATRCNRMLPRRLLFRDTFWRATHCNTLQQIISSPILIPGYILTWVKKKLCETFTGPYETWGEWNRFPPFNFVCACVSECGCIHRCMYVFYSHVHTLTHGANQTDFQFSICVSRLVCICVLVWIGLCVCLCVYIYAYVPAFMISTHALTHTRTRTRTCTHTWGSIGRMRRCKSYDLWLHVNESFTRMNESFNTYAVSHVMRINISSNIYEWVMPQVRISHVTYMNE